MSVADPRADGAVRPGSDGVLQQKAEEESGARHDDDDRKDQNDPKSPRRYDVVTESCEGYLIEQRAESEQKGQPQHQFAAEQPLPAVLEEVDGDDCFLLAAASADALVKNDDDDDAQSKENPPPPKAVLKHGDLVVWYCGQESLLDDKLPSRRQQEEWRCLYWNGQG